LVPTVKTPNGQSLKVTKTKRLKSEQISNRIIILTTKAKVDITVVEAVIGEAETAVITAETIIIVVRVTRHPTTKTINNNKLE